MIDLPPDWIIRAAKYAINRTTHWTEAIDILCAYYNVPRMACLTDKTVVPPKAVACYVVGVGKTEGYCYSQKSTVDANTIFHEFGHHLNAFLFKGLLTDESNEAFAIIFAEEMVKKWEMFS